MLPLSDEASRRTFPFVTVAIILLNVLVFIYELSLGDGVQQLVESAGVVPAEYACRCDIPPVDVGPFWVTLFTSMWLHGGWLHLIGNMVYLWIFGDNVEDALGHLGYLAFYLGGGIVAGGTQILAGPDSIVPGIGASGAIAAVLAAYVSNVSDSSAFANAAATSLSERRMSMDKWTLSSFATALTPPTR